MAGYVELELTSYRPRGVNLSTPSGCETITQMLPHPILV